MKLIEQKIMSPVAEAANMMFGMTIPISPYIVPYGIRNAYVPHDNLNGNEKWIAYYDSFQNDQNMLIVHPFGKANKEVFGLKKFRRLSRLSM